MDFLNIFKRQLVEQKGGISKVTLKNYLSDVRHFLNWFENTRKESFDPNKITSDDILLYEKSQGAKLENGRMIENTSLSEVSMKRHLSSLRKFVAIIEKEGLISNNPFDKIEPPTTEAPTDYWHIKGFKDYLLSQSVSKITIKNYLSDINGFAKWYEEAVIGSSQEMMTETQGFYLLTNSILEEYKKRLIEIQSAAPKTVNRKLSSLRKYLEYAVAKGFIAKDEINITPVQIYEDNLLKANVTPLLNLKDIAEKDIKIQHKYSKFPPLRLIQKLFIFPYLAFETKAADIVVKAISGKEFIGSIPLPQKVLSQVAKKNTLRDTKKNIFSLISNPTGKNNFFDKQDIPYASKPFHKKVIHHLRYTRPEWYKRYHSYAFVHYINFALLVIFASGVGVALYQNLVVKKQIPSFAAPVAPPRIMSFQGRLTDNLDNPISTPTDIRFAIYNDATASGAALLWQEVDYQVAPDQDGVFSVLLGNNTSIPASVFTDNASLYLGVTIKTTSELTPRQRIASVAYASNSEFLQGMLPITAAGAGTSNVVLALDSSGNLTIGGSANPTFTATGGQFTVSGQSTVIQTNVGSNGNVALSPDGLGKIDIRKPLVNTTNNGNLVPGGVEIDDKFGVLATESAVAAFVVNNNGGGDIFTASSSGNTKFTIDTGGNLIAKTYNNNGGILYTSTSGTIGQTIVGLSGQCLQSIGGGTPTWGACGSGGAFHENLGAIVPNNSTEDLLIGGTASNSAKFGFINISAGSPTATISGNLGLVVPAGSNPSALFNVLNGGSLNFQTSAGGDAGLSSRLFLANDGRIGINTINPFAKTALDVRGINGTGPTASISAKSSFASLIVDNSGTGDLITASASGVTNFIVDNNGNVTVGQGGNGKITAGVVDPYLVQNQHTTGTTSLTLQTMGGSGSDIIFKNQNTDLLHILQNGNVGIGVSNPQSALEVAGNITPDVAGRNLGSASTPFSTIYANNIVGSGSLGYWNEISGALSPSNITDDLLLGANATASAKIKLGGTTNATSFFNTGGNVGIGLTNPSQLLEVNGNSIIDGTLTANTVQVGALASDHAQVISSNGSGHPELQLFDSGIIDAQLTTNASGHFAMNTGLDVSGPITTTSSFGAVGLYSAGSGISDSPVGGELILRPASGNPGFINFTENGVTYWGALGVAPTTGALNYYTSPSNSTTFNGTARFTILQNGNIGIGNTSPISKLQVSGAVTGKALALIDGSVGNDQNLLVASQSGNTVFTLGNDGTLTSTKYTTNGGLLYTNGSGVFAQTGAGTSSQCLLGGTAPSFGSCSTGTAQPQFQTLAGAIVPFNSTEDLLIGGQATNSAKFAVLNVTGAGTPTASVSAGLNGGAFLTADGTLATTNNQQLTIGGANSGGLILKSFGNTVFHDAGFWNVYLGQNAGTNTGNSNTGIGYGTLSSNTTGYSNTAVGYGALASNQGGPQNTAIGYDALWKNTNGIANVAVGNGALQNNTTGGENVVVGYQAGFNNSAGNNNIFLGQQAGYNETGSNTLYISNSNTSSPLILGNFAQSSLGINVNDAGLGNTALIVNQPNGSDIFTASSSGTTKFTIANDGTLTTVKYTTNGGLLYTNASGVVGQTAAGTSGYILQSNGGGAPTWIPTSSISAGSVAFNNITSGTNTTAAMVVGSGASLNYTGTGTINASTLGGDAVTALPYVNNTTDTTLTRSGSGPYTLGLNLGNANTWTALQTLNAGLTVAGTTNINTTGTSNTSIGNSTGTLALTSSGLNVTTAGAASGVTTLSMNNQLTNSYANSAAVNLTGNASGITFGGTGTNTINTSSTNALSLLANSATLSVGGTIGNVGIGTTTPISKLDVEGTVTGKALVAVNGTAGNDQNLFVASQSGAMKFSIGNDGTLTDAAYTTNGGLLYTNASGVVGQTATGTSGYILQSNGGGAPTWVPTSGLTAGAVAFNNITTGTNTTATMTVGTGGTLTYSGSGTINASTLGGSAITALPYVNNTTDTTLTRSGSGPYTLGLNLGNANTWTGIQSFNSGDLALNGATSGTITLNASAVAGTNTLTLPAATDTLVGKATTDTFTNKTFDTAGTGNVLKINGNQVSAVTGTGNTLALSASPTFTGTVNTSALTASGSITANGGLTVASGQNLTLSGFTNNGGVIFANGSGVLSQTGAGTSSQCLIGGTTPSFGSCGTGIASAQFQTLLGSIVPLNSTEDLLIGGQATTSAKFAVLNVNNGTPTASVSAGTNGATYLTANGTLATTAKQSLTLGNANTGNIIFNGGNVGIGTNTPTLAGLQVSTQVGNTNAIFGGSYGISLISNQPTIGFNTYYNSNFIYQSSNGAAQIFSDSSGDLGFSTAPSGLAGNTATMTQRFTILQGGNVGIGTTGPSSLLSVGSSSQFQVNSSGAIAAATGIISSGTVTLSGFTGANNGGVIFANSAGLLSQTGAGTSSQCLIGGTTPSFGSCGAGANSVSPFQELSGAIVPNNSTEDLLIGGQATTSAKFAVLNVTGAGTPTASVSAGLNGAMYFTANGTLTTTNNQPIQIGGLNSGALVLQSSGAKVFHDDSSSLFLGAGAGLANTGTENVGIGINALNGALLTGNQNTAVGKQALERNGSGGANSVFGYQTLQSNVAGNNNTAFGYSAGYNGNGSGNVFLGYLAGFNETGSNTLYIANSSTTSPLILGNFAQSSLGINVSDAKLGNTALIVNQPNGSDIFTASASGNTKFTITNSGGIGLGGSIGTSGQCITGGSTASWGTCGGGGAFEELSGAIVPNNSTEDLLIGGQATTSAKFAVLNINGTRGTQTASLSGSLVLDSSTANIQTTNNQTLTLGGNSTGDIQFKPGNSSTSLYLASNGNVGIGTTTPNATMQVVGREIVGASGTTFTGTEKLKIAGGTSNDTWINITGSSNGVLSNDVSFILGQLGPVGFIGTASNNNFEFRTNNIARMTLNNNGALGINTGSPLANTTLDLRGISGIGPAASISAQTSFASLIVDNSGVGDLITASASGVPNFRVDNNGNVYVGQNGTGKIYANKVDPAYTIDGLGYATYAPTMVGTKEEYSGSAVLSYDASAGAYAYKLDFNNFQYQSGQWVFNRVIDPDITQIDVLMTPNSSARTWYKKDGANRTITLYADRPVEISYRLTAPTFDYRQWPTYTGHAIGLVPPPATTTGSGANDNNINVDPYFASLTINQQNGQWVLTDSNGNNVSEISAFSQAIVANVKAGLVNAQQIVTNSISASTSNLGNATANTLAVATNSITIGGQDIKDFILQTVTNAGFINPSQGIVSPLAEIDQIKTNVISPLASDSSVAINVNKDNIEVKNTKTNSTVAQITNNGDASFAGQLTANSATISGNLASNSLQTNDATISGTLHAGNIIANSIEGLNSTISSIAGNLIANNNNQTQIQTATTAGNLIADSITTGNLNSQFGIFEQGLTSMGAITATQITGMQSLSVGTSFVLSNNSINTLGADLQIQPLKQGNVSFMAGLVKIDTDGNMSVSGNLNLLGNIAAAKGIFQDTVTAKALVTNIISPLPGNDLAITLSGDSASISGKLKIQDTNGNEVLSIDNKGNVVSSGSAQFAKLNLNFVGQADAVSLTEATATGSAGFATLRAGQPELTIDNPNVTSKSLIYITPFGSSDNQVLYLLRQKANDPRNGMTGSFTVGVDGLATKDTQFNWLIVN